MRRVSSLAALVMALALVLSACGRDDPGEITSPDLGVAGSEKQAAQQLGFPAIATKNTTRVAGADPIANAAAIAKATFPGGDRDARPSAVVLVDVADWRAGIAAAQLTGTEARAPVLFSEGDEVPAATAQALEDLAPTGARGAGRAQVIRVGDVPEPEGFRTTQVRGRNPAALAAAIDRLAVAIEGAPTDFVMVATADDARFAMPAAGYAAKSGEPVLWVGKDQVPEATARALRDHQQPRIYVVGPSSEISPKVTRQLRQLGSVTRVGGRDPVTNAIEFAAFTDGRWGWGVQNPGHGLVFTNMQRTANAAAAAPLSASGKYGPLLVIEQADRLPNAVREYLLDIQPGYGEDYEQNPVTGFYNHGWIVGDEQGLRPEVQARIDALLEIAPVSDEPAPEEPEDAPEPRPRREPEPEPDPDDDAPSDDPLDPPDTPQPVDPKTTPEDQ
ncbi:MAG TPA: cell wall-binding repeat-containing protein [Solirubrobacteraceae bacterium]|nr:cell wall-binding repeat-containing protein [Solirubrobacteraceae bacterium]